MLNLMLAPYFYFFKARMFQCVIARALQLTSDNGCDLVPAGPDTVFDFTDKSGVDSIVHLQYLQLIFRDLHCVWKLSRHAAGT